MTQHQPTSQPGYLAAGPYPREFPTEAARKLIGFLRGQGGSKVELLLAGHELLGWALGLLAGQKDEPQLVLAGPPAQDDEEYAQALEGLLEAHGARPVSGGEGVPQ